MLRVRVELIPCGDFSSAEVLDEVFVTNDGTGKATGANEGGVGNYDIHTEAGMGGPRGRLGRVEGLPRTKGHRLELGIKALQTLRRGGGPKRAGL